MDGKIIDKIISNLKGNGARKIAIFGSFARGEETLKSDVDILVEFSDRKSLLEIVRIERELAEALNLNVDLLTEKSISPYLVDRIKNEAMVVYG